MKFFQRHETPRRNFNGMIGVYCQTCGREICLRTNSQFRSVVKCILCQLKEAGVENPEEHVLPQYLMLDPTKPPIPADAEGDGIILNLFPEEQEHYSRVPSSGGVAGTIKAIYRALGFKIEKPSEPVSQKTATKRRRESNLFSK